VSQDRGMQPVATPTVDQDPREPTFVQNPYAFYDLVRDRSLIFRWSQYGHLCTARYEDVNALLRDRRLGRQILHVASREELGWPPPDPRLADFDALERHSLLELEPPDHTRLRALVNRAFLSRQIERLRPRIAALAEGLLDRAGAGPFDLIEAYATPIPVIVIADLVGIDASHAQSLLDWSHRIVAMYQFRRTPEDEDNANAASRDFGAFVRGEIAERRRRPAEDLISHMIRAETEEGRLSEDEIVTTTILLLNAGHEATVHAIANSVVAILRSGLDPARMFATAETTEATIEEGLRYDPPLHMFTRYAIEPVEIGGNRLAKGERIGLLLGAANRDPTRIANPHRFDPGRKREAHVAFGAGTHFCLGAPLARLELAIALPALFARLPRLRLAEQPVYRDTYHFHGFERVMVEG
jgi:cytochrome P450